MADIDWQQEAIANNMAWYEAQCHSHGIPYTRRDTHWYTTRRMMPFYSNLVWAEAAAPSDLVAQLDAHAPADWGMKDAYAKQDMSAFGLKRLFDANWLVFRPDTPLEIAGAQVRAIAPSEFDAWVRAWGETPAGRPVFFANLLDNPAIKLYVAEERGAFAGGCATNLSGRAIGISNTFGSPAAIAACVAGVRRDHPDLGIVGYERGADLDAMARHGANVLGRLTVWIKA